MIKSVAIQGIRGSFHHIVSKNYFGNDIHLLECLSFDRAVDSLINEETDAVIMAIENSIAGSIIPNYALIDNKNLQVIGEYYLDIQHNLMALPKQSLNDIYEVYSHPMALLQCKDFFKKHPHIKLIEDKILLRWPNVFRQNKLKVWRQLQVNWQLSCLNSIF